jgi:hypothetical protein
LKIANSIEYQSTNVVASRAPGNKQRLRNLTSRPCLRGA